MVIGVAAYLAGCNAAEPTPSLIDPTTFVTYVHPSDVFTLNLPPDWVVNDASNNYAINVEFSPPDTPNPLIGIYVVSLTGIIGAKPTPPTPAVQTSAPSLPDLGMLATAYERTVYATGGASFQESARELMPDGSLRIKFFLSSGGAVTQHNDFVQIIGPYFVAMRTRLPDDSAQFRTVSRIINTMTINPLSSWSSITENQDARPQDVVGFSSLNAWVGRSSGFEIAGQVVNNSPEVLEFVQIQAQLYDGDNHVLAQHDDFVASDVLAAGQYTPFSIVFAGGMPPGTVRYDLHASARYAGSAAQLFYGPENFDVTTQSGVDSSGLLILQGEVTNQGKSTTSLIKVMVTLFDEQQRVIATDTILVDRQQLAPGETAKYSITFAELGGAPTGFVVNAQGVTSR